MSVYDSRIVRFLKRFRPVVVVLQNTQRYLGLLARPHMLSRYLKANRVRKLQIGSNICVLPGWLNTDLYPASLRSVTLDATRRFPFDGASFDYVFSEHQIEHIRFDDALTMLRECHRILRPGGKIRIALPSANPLLELFGPSRTELQNRYIHEKTKLLYPNAFKPSPCFALNAASMNWGHKFLYDNETLCCVLQNVGFTNVRFFAPGESDDANFTGIESRTSDIDRYETVVAQATRP
jgi:predicted SAM-dependent methyltransferase